MFLKSFIFSPIFGTKLNERQSYKCFILQNKTNVLFLSSKQKFLKGSVQNFSAQSAPSTQVPIKPGRSHFFRLRFGVRSRSHFFRLCFVYEAKVQLDFASGMKLKSSQTKSFKEVNFVFLRSQLCIFMKFYTKQTMQNFGMLRFYT